MRLADVPVNECTCPELLRLCLRSTDGGDDVSDASSTESDVSDEGGDVVSMVAI